MKGIKERKTGRTFVSTLAVMILLDTVALGLLLVPIGSVMAEGSCDEVAKMELPSFCTHITDGYIGNDFAFLKTFNEIYIIDISNLESPRFYGNISDYLPEIKSHSQFSMAVSQNRMYASMGPIYAFQISEGNISLVGHMDGSFLGISTNGNLVCAMSGTTPEELRIDVIDFTDPENPEKISEIPKTSDGNYPGGYMAFSGNELYVSYIGGTKTEIVKYDMKDPENPSIASKYSVEGTIASPFRSLSFSGKYVAFLSSVFNSYYLNVLPEKLGGSNRIKIDFLPISVTSSGDYVFVQNRTEIDFFVTDGNRIEKELTIHMDGTIAMSSASMGNNLFVVSEGKDGKPILHIIEVEGKLSENPDMFLIIGTAVIIGIVAIAFIYRKISKKEVEPEDK